VTLAPPAAHLRILRKIGRQSKCQAQCHQRGDQPNHNVSFQHTSLLCFDCAVVKLERENPAQGNALAPLFLAFGDNCVKFLPVETLTNARIRDLKARAQRLKATLKVGKEGLSPAFLAALDQALAHTELLKVKFDDFKEEKKTLAPELAEKSHSHLITRVGNVVVLFRPKPKLVEE